MANSAWDDRSKIRLSSDRSIDLVVSLVSEARGGMNRRRILSLLLTHPRNAHSIAEDLGLNYRTVKLHLRRLTEEGLVTPITSRKYGLAYGVTDNIKSNLQIREILERTSGN